jgi:hypothetical protein
MKRGLILSMVVWLIAASVAIAESRVFDDRGALLMGGRPSIAGIRTNAFNIGTRFYTGDDASAIGAYGSYRFRNGISLGVDLATLDDDAKQTGPTQDGLGSGTRFGGAASYEFFRRSYYSLSADADLAFVDYDQASGFGIGGGLTFGIGWDTDDECDCPWCWLWNDYDPSCGCWMCLFVEDYYFFGSMGFLYQRYSPDWAGASDQDYTDPVLAVGGRMTLKGNVFVGGEVGWADENYFQITAGYRWRRAR